MKRDNPLRIAWAKPDLCEEDYQHLKSCFDSGWISQGPQVLAFEARVAALAGRQHCIAVNSGTAALTAVLISLGVSESAEVVIPAMSFIALPYAVTMLGATPVLADIDPATGMITPETVVPCITERIKAVVGIDYAGFANDWDAVHASCKAHGVPLIVDAASSFLATTQGRPAGSFGDMAVFSFHSAKVITTGEGGAIVTDNEELASRLRQIRNHGELPGRKYFYDRLGGNFRMTDIAACLGLSQLNRMRGTLDRRRWVLDLYLGNATMQTYAYCFHHDPSRSSNTFTFTVLLPKGRNNVQHALQSSGVETRVMWPFCVDEEPAYRRYQVRPVGTLNNARQFSHSCLSLPVHSGLDRTEIEHVVSTFESCVT